MVQLIEVCTAALFEVLQTTILARSFVEIFPMSNFFGKSRHFQCYESGVDLSKQVYSPFSKEVETF